MTKLVPATKLKLLIAIESFKSDLATIGLDEIEIQDALDEAESRTAGVEDFIQSLVEVKDEIMIRRHADGAKKPKV